MWWRVYCKGCRDEYIVCDSLDLKLTCMRLGCGEFLHKVEKVERDVVDRELRKPYVHGKMNNTTN